MVRRRLAASPAANPQIIRHRIQHRHILPRRTRPLVFRVRQRSSARLPSASARFQSKVASADAALRTSSAPPKEYSAVARSARESPPNRPAETPPAERHPGREMPRPSRYIRPGRHQHADYLRMPQTRRHNQQRPVGGVQKIRSHPRLLQQIQNHRHISNAPRLFHLRHQRRPRLRGGGPSLANPPRPVRRGASRPRASR